MLSSLKYDGKILIATGTSRKETAWKTEEWQWSDIVARMMVTIRTAETYASYILETPERQTEIKDIGGFLLGRILKGRRKKENIIVRSGLCFDLDFAEPGFWKHFTGSFGCAAAVYSTHKHSPDAARIRLVIPFNRTVFPDEYEAIGRMVASMLGIDQFDDTTYTIERFMYWPSTSKDGLFESHYQDGPFLDPSVILAKYHDWHDISEWPTSSRQRTVIPSLKKKVGDPLEKTGWIGSFCKTYTITQAMAKFLSEDYTPTDTEDRYTYSRGTAAAGVVVYEDKWAFSHHSTDPISGQLVNAFDLVRLNLFGSKDEDVKESTPITALPSYKAMIDFAMSDEDVRMTSVSERLEEAQMQFADEPVDEPTDGPQKPKKQKEPVAKDWMKHLQMDKKSVPYPTIENIVLILRNDPKLKGCFGINLFEGRAAILKDLPWRKFSMAGNFHTDADDSALRHYLEKYYSISGKDKITDALNVVGVENSFHPVRDFLDPLVWDGKPRLDKLFIDYLGAADTPYTRTVTRKAFTAAVARIYEPGIKFDHILVLIGFQGSFKSTILFKMSRGWFTDSITSVTGKEAYSALSGAWLVEIAELAGMKRSDIETIKNYISKPHDRYREAYGRRTENHPRQSVFFGTTNDPAFLRDTANRRFWPVVVRITIPVKSVADMNEAEIKQLWAEAKHYYKEGETLYLDDSMERLASSIQSAHMEVDPRAGAIERYLNTLLPESWPTMTLGERRGFLHSEELYEKGTVVRTKVCVAEIWCELLEGNFQTLSKYAAKELYNTTASIPGWQPAKCHSLRFGYYGMQKALERVEVGGVKVTVDPSLTSKN